MHFYTHILYMTWKYLCVVCTDYLEECLVSKDLNKEGCDWQTDAQDLPDRCWKICLVVIWCIKCPREYWNMLSGWYEMWYLSWWKRLSIIVVEHHWSPQLRRPSRCPRQWPRPSRRWRRGWGCPSGPRCLAGSYPPKNSRNVGNSQNMIWSLNTVYSDEDAFMADNK